LVQFWQFSSDARATSAASLLPKYSMLARLPAASVIQSASSIVDLP
jgi:hypothetical protein